MATSASTPKTPRKTPWRSATATNTTTPHILLASGLAPLHCPTRDPLCRTQPKSLPRSRRCGHPHILSQEYLHNNHSRIRPRTILHNHRPNRANAPNQGGPCTSYDPIHHATGNPHRPSPIQHAGSMFRAQPHTKYQVNVRHLVKGAFISRSHRSWPEKYAACEIGTLLPSAKQYSMQWRVHQWTSSARVMTP